MANSAAEKNALQVQYEVAGNPVVLDMDFVKKYLVRGSANLVTTQEVLFFMNTCKMQRLNPLVNGETYLIKYDEKQPANMVVGKTAYLKRAFEHPEYICKEDGIIVEKGDETYAKEGTCLYKGETLVGGWCRVHFMRNGAERTAYKEVSMLEYGKNQATWKNLPATMIAKVAISQCVREAFPKDYEGLYSEYEMEASGAIPDNAFVQSKAEEDPIITQEERLDLFNNAKGDLGDNYQDTLKEIFDKYGIESSATMKKSEYVKVVDDIAKIVKERAKANVIDVEAIPVAEPADAEPPWDEGEK